MQFRPPQLDQPGPDQHYEQGQQPSPSQPLTPQPSSTQPQQNWQQQSRPPTQYPPQQSQPEWQQSGFYGSPQQPFPPQPQPYYQQPMPPMPPQPVQPGSQRPPKKKSHKKLWIGLIVGVIVLVIIISAMTHGGVPHLLLQRRPHEHLHRRRGQRHEPTPAPTPKPTAKPAPTFLQFGDGSYQVGKDIQSGTYRTRVGSPGCYYARLSGFGGTFGEIIANNDTDAPAIVTIATTDTGFTSQNCGTWTKDVSQITTSKTTFGDGMYIIGTDITPGTYRNTGSQGCYYARLSGFGNTTDDILANNNVDTSNPVVQSALE